MPVGEHYGWMHDMMGWGMWMVPWGWILVAILLVILVYAIAGLGGIRTSGPQRGSSTGEEYTSETPLEILKKRYARGEISREDFEQMKQDLS